LPILVEDVLLGLCGKLQAIWVLSETSASQVEGHLDNVSQRIKLSSALDSWKHELDTINEVASLKDIPNNPTAARNLLLAYRAEDDSTSASLKRIKTLIQDATVLYHFLKMSHYLGPAAQGTKNYRRTETEPTRASKADREAFACAQQLLELAEAHSVAGDVGGGASASCRALSLNPLLRHAFATGLDVTNSVLSCQKCKCYPGRPSRQTAASTSMNLEQWIEAGGPLSINDTPICVCKLEVWSGRFEKAIRDQMKVTGD